MREMGEIFYFLRGHFCRVILFFFVSASKRKKSKCGLLRLSRNNPHLLFFLFEALTKKKVTY